MYDYGSKPIKLSEIRENVDKLNNLMKELEDRFTDNEDLRKYFNSSNDSIDPGSYYENEEYDKNLSLKVHSILKELTESFGIYRL